MSLHLDPTNEIYYKLLENQFKIKIKEKRLRFRSFVVRSVMGAEGRMQAR